MLTRDLRRHSVESTWLILAARRRLLVCYAQLEVFALFEAPTSASSASGACEQRSRHYGSSTPVLPICRQNLAREGSFTRSQATSKHKQTNIMHIIYIYMCVCVIHIISPGLIRFHLDFCSNYRFALPVPGVKLAFLLVLSREDWSGHFSVTRFKATHRFDSTSYKHVSCSIM